MTNRLVTGALVTGAPYERSEDYYGSEGSSDWI